MLQDTQHPFANLNSEDRLKYFQILQKLSSPFTTSSSPPFMLSPQTPQLSQSLTLNPTINLTTNPTFDRIFNSLEPFI